MKDIEKYGLYNTGECISLRYVMSGLGWLLEI